MVVQRPIIWLASTEKITTPQSNWLPQFIRDRLNPQYGQIVWSWAYTNYGKTPPQNILIDHFMRLGDGPWKRSHGRPPKSFGAPIPPGKVDFATVVSDPIPESEYVRLSNLDHSISIKIHIEYADVYGNKYETGICFENLTSGPIGYCEDGNYIK